MTAIDDAFNTLFFGSGSYLGILLLLALVIGLFLKWKYSAILTFPITLFLGMEYLDNSLNYHAGIMFFTTAFILMALYMKRDTRG